MANEVFGYSLMTDVIYGKGKITDIGTVKERDLLMDVYLPTDSSINTKNKPAVILVHGGTIVLNAAYGIKSSVKAAFPLSPTAVGYDFSKTIDSPDLPPMLVLMSQFDVEATLESLPHLKKIAERAGLDHNLAWLPGFGYFYPTGAVSLGDDGVRISVGERVIQFLDKNMQ